MIENEANAKFWVVCEPNPSNVLLTTMELNSKWNLRGMVTFNVSIIQRYFKMKLIRYSRTFTNDKVDGLTLNLKKKFKFVQIIYTSK